MTITSLERVLITVPNLERSTEAWRCAGFGVLQSADAKSASVAAGAVQIEFCTAGWSDPRVPDASSYIAEAEARGGGIFGWVWSADSSSSEGSDSNVLEGIFTAMVPSSGDTEARRNSLKSAHGSNSNSVEYLDHIVVMVPELQLSIDAFGQVGMPCKRIREAGRGMRQAFFKIEQTVFEVVGPSPGPPRCWGLAFMCADIDRAVAVARENGLSATSPKTAVQGGRIARIVDPIDNVAVALMDKATA